MMKGMGAVALLLLVCCGVVAAGITSTTCSNQGNGECMTRSACARDHHGTIARAMCRADDEFCCHPCSASYPNGQAPALTDKDLEAVDDMSTLLNAERFQCAFPRYRGDASSMIRDLNSAATRFNLNTRSHLTMWLAQMAYESMDLTEFRELGLLRTNDWRDCDCSVGAVINDRDGNPRTYQSNSGPEFAGKTMRQGNCGCCSKHYGCKFIGRGGIQLTFIDPYRTCGRLLGHGTTWVDTPEVVEQQGNAIMGSACFFSHLKEQRCMREGADTGTFEGFGRTCSCVKGDMDSLCSRFDVWLRMLRCIPTRNTAPDESSSSSSSSSATAPSTTGDDEWVEERSTRRREPMP